MQLMRDWIAASDKRKTKIKKLRNQSQPFLYKVVILLDGNLLHQTLGTFTNANHIQAFCNAL